MIDKWLLDTYVVYIYGLNISTDMFYLSQLFYRSMFLDFNIPI